MKQFKIFGQEIIPVGAINQMQEAMNNDFVVSGALMTDSHEGYSMPIGGVIITKDIIVPAWVGYDIGCGMCAINTGLSKKDILGEEVRIFKQIYRDIPVSHGEYNKNMQDVDLDKIKKTKIAKDILKENKGNKQIGTLGGGNHFIEVSYDENENIRIIIHSGSRGIGYKIAEHYMDLSKKMNFKNIELITELEKKFDNNKKHFGVKKYNLEKYEELKGNYVLTEIKKISKNREGHFGLRIDSVEGQDYFIDMNFGLEFALLNRELMLKKVIGILKKITGKNINVNFKLKEKGGDLINRNHNHCVEKEGLFIHRKGATHSEKGMYGIIPGNMRDGSFVVLGKGSPDSLFSSSHGAGRKYGRNEAKKKIDLNVFKKDMIGIIAKIDEATIDESPEAYKDIFEVMKYQQDNVEIISYLRPIINIKG